MLRFIKEQLLLLPVIYVVRGGIMFVWLSSFWFVERRLVSSFVFWGFLFVCLFVFSCSFPPCVEVFHLLSFMGLDLWKDIVKICVIHGISWFVHL
jgi:hypothetical protein